MNPVTDDTPERSPRGRPANVLLRTPRSGPEPPPCPENPGAPDGRLLVVSLGGDPNERVTARRSRRGLPAEVAVLAAAETRSTQAAAPGPTTTQGGTNISWATVADAGDVTDVGLKIDRCLSAWSDEPSPIEVCFDSITGLLGGASLHTSYRFLHVLQRRIEAADATAHYHMDPEELSRRASSTVETLFDPVLEYDAATASWRGA